MNSASGVTDQMRMFVLLILSLLLLCTFAFAQNAEGVTIAIERVARSINTEQRNKSTGVIKLRFMNNSHSDSEVILASTIGYPNEILSKRRLPLTQTYTGGGDFATVRVEWIKNGVKVSEEEVKLMGEPLEIKPGGCRFVLLPVTLPKTAGDYDLKLCFDNRNLKELAETFADHNADVSRFFQFRIGRAIRVDRL